MQQAWDMRGSNKAYARRTFCNHVCSLCLCNVQAASQVFTLLANCFPSLHCTYKLLTESSPYIQTSSRVFTLRSNCFLSLPWRSNTSMPKCVRNIMKTDGFPTLRPPDACKSNDNQRFFNNSAPNCFRNTMKTNGFLTLRHAIASETQ